MPRRNHSGVIITRKNKKYLLVYGGVNNVGSYMKDVWLFNLSTFVWKKETILS